ncbi:MAG TPA: hypothetical protein VKT70_10745 [Stellaceae bacterium]|nr:hypothetical protein [Stellaceae bacterium]
MKKGLFLLIGLAFALSACNTLAGFGEDLKAAGSTLTGSADKAKP